MHRPFFGPRIKLERAREQIIQLGVLEREFFDSNAPTMDTETEPGTGNKLVFIRLRADVPPLVHVLTGEVVYHLRSALDQVAVALARMSTGNPDLAKIAFPSGKHISAFNEEISKKLKGVDEDFIELIRQLAPHGNETDNKIACREQIPYTGNIDFYHVFPMANHDNHREIIPASAHGALQILSNFHFVNSIGGITIDGTLRSLEQGILLTTLAPNGAFEPRNPQAKLRISGKLLLGNVGTLSGKPLVHSLATMHNATERALRHIEGACIEMGRIDSNGELIGKCP